MSEVTAEERMGEKRRPTIRELEDILKGDGERGICLRPDGSITSVGEDDCEQETPIDDRIRSAVAAQKERLLKWARFRRIDTRPGDDFSRGYNRGLDDMEAAIRKEPS